MPEEITEIKPAEITQPKKLANKAVGVLEMGLGGVVQEAISQMLAGVMPAQLPPEMAKVLETLGLMTASGVIKNKHLKRIAGGAVAGSAKDITKMLLAKLNINLSNLGGIMPRLGSNAGVNLPSRSVVVAATLSDSDLEGY